MNAFPQMTNCAADEARLDRRSNVFLSAVLEFGGSSHAVRIRNLSRLGALLDGAVLPNVGDVVCLRRGKLSASGTVTWRKKFTFGLRFSSKVPVQEWLEHGTALGGQLQIAGNVSEPRIRNSVEGAAKSPQPILTENEHPQIAEQLRALGEILKLVEAELCELPMVFGATANSRRKLGIVRQQLGKLSARLAPGPRA